MAADKNEGDKRVGSRQSRQSAAYIHKEIDKVGIGRIGRGRRQRSKRQEQERDKE